MVKVQLESLLNFNLAQWQYTEWSKCSKSCGNGTKFRNATCLGSNDKKCDEKKKETLTKFCNTEACLSGWRTEKWSDCDCKGLQKRYVENWRVFFTDHRFQKSSVL